jgi:glycolate oxidase FAD binding subunit
MDEADIAAAVRDADRLTIIGGGTRGPICDGTPLNTAGLTGVTLFEPAAMTLVARSGTTLAEIDAVLAAEGQRLAFEPPDMRAVLGREGQSTIGGVIAANAAGPRRLLVGAARDALLGVRFVDGRGDVISNGGRVMKNVTGYDLTKLMAGSFGQLGVLTEVSLKVMPIPEHTGTLFCILSSPLADPIPAMAAVLATPYEPSGLAWYRGQLSLRVEGFAASVADRMDKLSQILARFGAVERGAADPWQKLRDVTALADYSVLARVGIKPSLCNSLRGVLPMGSEVMIDWGGGLIWVAGNDPSLIPTLRQFCVTHGGHTTVLKGTAPVFQPQSHDALTARLRAQFDPRGIFNQGL